jgi:hypothetical protein
MDFARATRTSTVLPAPLDPDVVLRAETTGVVDSTWSTEAAVRAQLDGTGTSSRST